MAMGNEVTLAGYDMIFNVYFYYLSVSNMDICPEMAPDGGGVRHPVSPPLHQPPTKAPPMDLFG